MSSTGGSPEPGHVQREILDVAPHRELDPRVRRLAFLALIALTIVGLALRTHHRPQRITAPTIQPPIAGSQHVPPPDIYIAYTHALPDAGGQRTFIAMELLNTSGRTLTVRSAALTKVGLPVALEVLGRISGNEVLARPISELSHRFTSTRSVKPLTVQAGELFYVLIEISPHCGHIGTVAPAPMVISYSLDRAHPRTIDIPVQDVTGAISWLDDTVGQACGTASNMATETTTRIIDGITLTTTGPEIIPNGPFPITVTATNFSSATFTGSIGIFVQGELRVPAAGSRPLAGGLVVSDHAPNVFSRHGTGYLFNGTAWYQSGVLHSGEKMVPGGSFVWTFLVSFKRPPESVGQLRGWLPGLLAIGPDARPILPAAGDFPELTVL